MDWHQNIPTLKTIFTDLDEYHGPDMQGVNETKQKNMGRVCHNFCSNLSHHQFTLTRQMVSVLIVFFNCTWKEKMHHTSWLEPPGVEWSHFKVSLGCLIYSTEVYTICWNKVLPRTPVPIHNLLLCSLLNRPTMKASTTQFYLAAAIFLTAYIKVDWSGLEYLAPPEHIRHAWNLF